MNNFFLYVGICTVYSIGLLAVYIALRFTLDAKKRNRRKKDNEEYFKYMKDEK